MKNFDEPRDIGDIHIAGRDELLEIDRTFQLGGETFTRRPIIHPRVMARYWSLDGTIDQEMLEEIYSIIVACVEPADQERFKARLEDEDDPVSYLNLRELLAWFISEDTGRPLSQPSDSTPGPAQTTATSTEGSPSPATPTAPKPPLSAVS